LVLACDPNTIVAVAAFLDLLPPLLVDGCDVVVMEDLNLLLVLIPYALELSLATFLFFFWFFFPYHEYAIFIRYNVIVSNV